MLKGRKQLCHDPNSPPSLGKLPPSYGGQPSLKPRLASRSFSEGWWRRRELNPRPKSFPR